jgi:hypothetical protein
MSFPSAPLEANEEGMALVQRALRDIYLRLDGGSNDLNQGAEDANQAQVDPGTVTPESLGLGDAAYLPVGTTAGTVAAGDDSRITGAAQKAANLSDLAHAATARGNLGLGGAATLSVGTTAGTVAAGNDSRITGAAQKAANLSDLTNAATARTNLGLTGATASVSVNEPAGTKTISFSNGMFTGASAITSREVMKLSVNAQAASSESSTSCSMAVDAAGPFVVRIRGWSKGSVSSDNRFRFDIDCLVRYSGSSWVYQWNPFSITTATNPQTAAVSYSTAAVIFTLHTGSLRFTLTPNSSSYAWLSSITLDVARTAGSEPDVWYFVSQVEYWSAS